VTAARPCASATFFGGIPDWSATFDGQWLQISDGTTISPHQIRDVDVQRKLMWSNVVVSDDNGRQTLLPGLDHNTARQLGAALDQAAVEVRRRAGLLQELHANGPRIAAWWSQAVATMSSPQWVTHSQVKALVESRPRSTSGPGLAECWSLPDLAAHVAALPAVWAEAVSGWAHVDLGAWAAQTNAGLLWNEKQVMRDWFDTIEKSPLTDEQIDAVVRFDNRTLVVAAAGSGKTSTMVAKAAYAIARGIAEPNEILMLAFNDQAAKEMGKRVTSRLTGPVPDTMTFHAFGLRVIGEAQHHKPGVVDLGDDDGIARLSQIVDRLREADRGFRWEWDLFRIVFGQALAVFDEGFNRDGTRSARFPTMNGELVRSQGEQMIANWLWVNGVNYEYERPYEHDVADDHHAQYRPDFYYPELGVYHEHWAVDSHGSPPPAFKRYGADMDWKRATHLHYGTTLLETRWGDLLDGTLLESLHEQLTRFGAVLDENPYREAPGQPPIEDEQMLRLVRKFLVHAKSNRIDLGAASSANPRDRLFLRLAGRILTEWDAGLGRDDLVDFEDMLNRAADLIHARAWPSKYKLVMVDEMQDTSLGRARLIQALLAQNPYTYLFAVGDDWQSINRFAGSDVSVMSDFEDWFGPADTCYLTRTFRSPQSLCDLASAFISKNPHQIMKRVVSDRPGPQSPVTAVAVQKAGISQAVAEHLQALDEAADAPTSVLLLGRYNDDLDPVRYLKGQRWAHLSLTLSTVHSAKGTEADHVVVLNVCKGAFPSTIQDDPLLELAMPNSEDFPHAEERRLFYVALTRARRSVLLVTRGTRKSPFLGELGLESLVAKRGIGQDAGPAVECPDCHRGVVVPRRRRSDGRPFWGCSRFSEGCSWMSSWDRRPAGSSAAVSASC